MPINLTFPVTGAAQTGFASPTYSGVSDRPPSSDAVQWAITTVGGTQTGVVPHSASVPFTFTFVRPKSFKRLMASANQSAVLTNVPVNRYKIHVRKGMAVMANQPTQLGFASIEVGIPAGADVQDPASIRAMCSLAIGALQQISAGLGDTLVTGVV